MGVLDHVQKQFRLPDQKFKTFMNEIYGGIAMYFASLYVLTASPMWEAGECLECLEELNVTSPMGYNAEQYRNLPATVALAAGISTLVMGFGGNMPMAVTPAIAAMPFGPLAKAITPGGAQACALIVGLIVLTFAIFSKQIKIIGSTPEDFRLGVAAGKGGVIALIYLRSAGLVSDTTTSYNAFFDYNVILTLFGLLIIALAQAREYMAFSFIGTVIIVTALSLIVRVSTDSVIVDPVLLEMPNISSMVSVPSFAAFNYANGFIIGQYIITASINLVIDIVATVTALILMCVVRTNVGYDKETFTSVLSESTKCYRIFISIAVCQVFLSPFLGVAPVSECY